MTRTTTPDQYSASVKRLYADMRAKRIAAFVFAAAIEQIWKLRHAGA